MNELGAGANVERGDPLWDKGRDIDLTGLTLKLDGKVIPSSCIKFCDKCSNFDHVKNFLETDVNPFLEIDVNDSGTYSQQMVQVAALREQCNHCHEKRPCSNPNRLVRNAWINGSTSNLEFLDPNGIQVLLCIHCGKFQPTGNADKKTDCTRTWQRCPPCFNVARLNKRSDTWDEVLIVPSESSTVVIFDEALEARAFPRIRKLITPSTQQTKKDLARELLLG